MLKKQILTLCTLLTLALACSKNDKPDTPDEKSGSAEITVYDATQWSTTDTLGKPAADADVSLYKSRQDYNNGGQPAFTGKTAANGKIVFTKLDTGTYYLVSRKEDKFNYFVPELVNGELVAYKPLGIFQNQNQVNALPRLGAQTVGDFIFLDANQDGIITYTDKTWIPFEVVVAGNKTVQVNSLIGYLNNSKALPFTTQADAQQALNNLYTSIFAWHQLQTVIDGVMSDDADCSTLSTFCAFNNFSFDATNSYTSSFWVNGFSYITQLNRLISSVPALNLTSTDANNLIGQAKGLRAFIYYELATYFGGVPLQTGISGYNLSRSSLADTYTFIKNDLTAAMNILPLRFTGTDHNRIGADACKLLLARVAMAQGDYQSAATLSSDLINRSVYSLVSRGSLYINDDNVEIIWNIQTGFVSTYNAFYNASASKTFSPVARYAEVLLINTEANIYLNVLNANYINQLLMFRSQPTVTFTDAAQAMDIVRTAWKNELPREGQRFAKLVKWGKATEVLGANGYKSYNGLLPVPSYVLISNPNIVQNPGY